MFEKLTNGSVLAKPDFLQVFSFNGAGGVSDQLPLKPNKSVSNYSFLFLAMKFESAYFDKPQIAISGTKHTLTTPNGNIIHRKTPMSTPITDCVHENSNRGNGPRGLDG